MTMKEIKIQDVTYNIPDYDVVMHENKPYIRIKEGMFEGVEYTYDNIKFNEEDSSLIEYNLYTTSRFADAEMEKFQEVTNSIVLAVLDEAFTQFNNTSQSE
jgi:hypothetical protein